MAKTNQTKPWAAGSLHEVARKQRDEGEKRVELSPEHIQRGFAYCLASACQPRHGAASIGRLDYSVKDSLCGVGVAEYIEEHGLVVDGVVGDEKG